MTRARMRRLPVRAPRRSARTYRYCVKQAAGGVTAAFSSKARRGKAKLITTTAKGSGNRRATVGTTAARFRKAFPNRVRAGRGLYRLGRGSTRIAGIRKGRVRFYGVTSKAVARRPALMRRYLRVAGLR